MIRFDPAGGRGRSFTAHFPLVVVRATAVFIAVTLVTGCDESGSKEPPAVSGKRSRATAQLSVTAGGESAAGFADSAAGIRARRCAALPAVAGEPTTKGNLPPLCAVLSANVGDDAPVCPQPSRVALVFDGDTTTTKSELWKPLISDRWRLSDRDCAGGDSPLDASGPTWCARIQDIAERPAWYRCASSVGRTPKPFKGKRYNETPAVRALDGLAALLGLGSLGPRHLGAAASGEGLAGDLADGPRELDAVIFAFDGVIDSGVASGQVPSDMFADKVESIVEHGGAVAIVAQPIRHRYVYVVSRPAFAGFVSSTALAIKRLLADAGAASADEIVVLDYAAQVQLWPGRLQATARADFRRVTKRVPRLAARQVAPGHHLVDTVSCNGWREYLGHAQVGWKLAWNDVADMSPRLQPPGIRVGPLTLRSNAEFKAVSTAEAGWAATPFGVESAGVGETDDVRIAKLGDCPLYRGAEEASPESATKHRPRALDLNHVAATWLRGGGEQPHQLRIEALRLPPRPPTMQTREGNEVAESLGIRRGDTTEIPAEQEKVQGDEQAASAKNDGDGGVARSRAWPYDRRTYLALRDSAAKNAEPVFALVADQIVPSACVWKLEEVVRNVHAWGNADLSADRLKPALESCRASSAGETLAALVKQMAGTEPDVFRARNRQGPGVAHDRRLGMETLVRSMGRLTRAIANRPVCTVAVVQFGTNAKQARSCRE